MKDTPLREQLKSNQDSINIMSSLFQSSTSNISINNKSVENYKIRLAFSVSKTNLSQILSQKKFQDLSISSDEYTKAKNCLAAIEDPLWKRVCQDIIKTMGFASFLEIWECALGEISSHNKQIDIYCPTEKAAQFIKQYSFVFLGSLKTYFPALKEITLRIILP